MKMTDDLLSGDDTGLKNIWDEVCVQVRYQHSIYWGVYLDVIDGFIYDEIKTLDSNTKQAIWLQTDEGRNWVEDYEGCDGEREETPYINEGDIIEYIRQCYILSAADNWTNKRIEKYLDMGYGE